MHGGPRTVVLALAATAAAAGRAGGEESLPRWRLPPGSLAEYAHYPVTVDGNGVRKRGKATPHGLFGHTLEGARAPSTPTSPTSPGPGR